MPGIELFLSFVQIVFPIFLLIPPLITSFNVLIPLSEVAAFFVLLWVDYAVLVIVEASSAVIDSAWIVVFLIIVSAILVGVTLFLVMRWTLHEQAYLEATLTTSE